MNGKDCHLAGERMMGNFFRRSMEFSKSGDRVDGHAHNFDHVTLVFTGSIRVKAKLPTGEVERVFHAPDWVLIKAGVEHEITALENGTVCWCLYSHRTPQGDVVQEETGFERAYA